MKFPSKQGWLVHGLTTGIFIVGMPLIIYMRDGEIPTGFFWIAAVAIGIGGVVILVQRGTYYVVTDKELTIYSMFKQYDQIKLTDIVKVKRTYNPAAAPAPSLRRLEVTYGRWGMVLISPKNEKYFLEVLQEKNPTVEIDEKLR